MTRYVNAVACRVGQEDRNIREALDLSVGIVERVVSGKRGMLVMINTGTTARDSWWGKALTLEGVRQLAQQLTDMADLWEADQVRKQLAQWEGKAK